MPGITARITDVTLYTAGARVRRVATVDATLKRVRIDGLPRSVIDDTLRVEVVGPSVATSLSAGRDAPAASAAAAETPAAVRSAERAVALAETEQSRIEGALGSLAQAPVVSDPPSNDEPPAAWDAVLAARRALVTARAEREVALREQHIAAKQRVVEARRVLAAEQDREARATGDRAPKLHELRTYVDVELEPAPDAAGTIELTLEYIVGAARWVPSYVARLDGDQATVEVRALVAQAAGEDWTGVTLVLSTAEPTRFATLPELHAQKIGRRQQEPAKKGFRAAPVGAGALYADYDRTRPPRTVELKQQELRTEVWDDGSSNAKDAFQTPPEGKLMPPPAPMAAAPMPDLSAFAVEPARKSRSMFSRGGGGGAPPAPGAPPPMQQAYRRSAPRDQAEEGMVFGGMAIGVPAGPAPARLDYGSLRMAGPTASHRGQLVPATGAFIDLAGGAEVAAAAARVAALPLPPGCRADWSHAYDYAFTADGRVEVAADGAWHSIAVTSLETTAKLRHVATPREQQDVFRIATLANPFTGPLLPGPIDIYDQGRFLLTSDVEFTPPGATVEVGLGVDASVKIARNTEFQEEVTGMLRGGLRLHHTITVDVENLSPRAIELEVRERIPVTRDGEDEIEVTTGRVEPAWERFHPDPDASRDQKLRGGYRWCITVPPAKKQTLRAGYEIKIAGKHELVGGNRRES